MDTIHDLIALGLCGFIAAVLWNMTTKADDFPRQPPEVGAAITLVGSIIVPAFLFAVFGRWSGLVAVVLAGIVSLIGIGIFIQIHKWRTAHQVKRDAEDRVAETQSAVARARANLNNFVDAFMVRYEQACLANKYLVPVPDTLNIIKDIVRQLYLADFVAPYEDRLKEIELSQQIERRRISPDRALELFERHLLDCFLVYARYLPLGGEGLFTVPISAVMPVKPVVQGMLAELFLKDDKKNYAIFHDLHQVIDKNRWRVTQSKLSQRDIDAGERVHPGTFDGPPDELVKGYFRDTPFLRLFDTTVPLRLPDQTRFEHQWVVAPPGSGKTQLLQTQILSDLNGPVMQGRASLVVIDSQPLRDGGFLSNIARLKLFAPGQPLEGKLVFLRPEMSEPGAKQILTPALNVFDVGQHNPDLSARDRQILQGSALNMITFALSDTTGHQDAMIRFLVQLGMNVEGVTINTVRRMLIMPKGEFLKTYEQPLQRVSEVVRDYFTHTFHTQGLNVTREAVARRFMELMSNTTFESMFQNDRNAIDLRNEIDSGKVILIHTDKALLGPAGCELFGRFFISLILQATLQRQNDNPVFVYIDECADYIKNDENTATLIDQARKQRVGFIFSHQRLRQIINPNVLSALSTCPIKFASRNEDDSRTMAQYLRTEENFIRDMPKLSFACHVRDVTTGGAIKADIKYGQMEALERMTDQEYAEMCQQMRERYCDLSRLAGAPSSPPPRQIRRGEVTDVQVDDQDVIH